MLIYYLTGFITLLSALLGLLFSVRAVFKGNGRERTNALYLFARSTAIAGMSMIPLFVVSNGLLLFTTGAMLVIQLIDGIIGISIKDRMRTAGPFVMALLHTGCLVMYL